MLLIVFDSIQTSSLILESEEREPLVAYSEAFQMIGQSNYHIPQVESGLIGRYDEDRTQTTLKRAGCFDDKKYLRCAALVNQVHTRIMFKKCRHEEHEEQP